MAEVVLPFDFRDGPGNVASGRQVMDNLHAITGQVNGGLDGDNIADRGVGTSELADAAATTAKLADRAVTTAKLEDGAATARKVALLSGEASLTTDRYTPRRDPGGDLALEPVSSDDDLPGASLRLTVDVASIVIVQAVFDIEATLIGDEWHLCTGGLAVNGTTQGKYARFLADDANDAVTSRWRQTFGQTYRLALAAGTHTFVLRARKNSAIPSASFWLRSGGTCLTAFAFSQ